MPNFIFFAFIVLFMAACSTSYSLKDRSGNVYIVEGPEIEGGGDLEYRTGEIKRTVEMSEIVSISMPNPEPKVFDGKVFYPATLAIEDTVSLPGQGFICVEGFLTAKNAGNKISIPFANVEELSVKKE